MVIQFADQIVCGESPVTCHNTTDRSDKCKSSVILKFTRGSGRIIVYDSGNETVRLVHKNTAKFVYSTKFCWPELKTGWVTCGRNSCCTLWGVTQAYWSSITPPPSTIIVDGLSLSKSQSDLRVSAWTPTSSLIKIRLHSFRFLHS